MKLIGNGQNEPSQELALRLKALNDQIQKEFGDGNFIIVGKVKGIMSGNVLASCSDQELPNLVNQVLLQEQAPRRLAPPRMGIAYPRAWHEL